MRAHFLFSAAIIIALISCQKEESDYSFSNSKAANGKIKICHKTDEMTYNILDVGASAWPAHQAHGDVRIDDEDGDGFVPVNGCGYGTQKVSIGDLFLGGKVGYIFQLGDPGYIPNEQHGLIISINLGYAEWGCVNVLMNGADGTALGTGKQNTEDIINGCPTVGIAARLCADHSVTQNNIVYDDWFLGSIEEMKKLVRNRDEIGGFPNNDLYAWTSTENSIPDQFGNTRDAWGVNFYLNLNEGWKWKAISNGINVIPIRYF